MYYELMDRATVWIDANMELATTIFATTCIIILLIAIIGVLNRYLGRREREEMLFRAKRYGEEYMEQVKLRLEMEKV